MSSGRGDTQNMVQTARDASSQMRASMEKAENSPETEFGLTEEEIARRKKIAGETRTIKGEGTSRPFEVKSSAHAQQVMTQGVVKKQREVKRRQLQERTAMMRRAQYVVGFLGLAFGAWFCKEILYPRYEMMQERNKRMAIRQEMAAAKMQEYLEAKRQSESQVAPTPATPIETSASSPSTSSSSTKKSWWRIF